MKKVFIALLSVMLSSIFCDTASSQVSEEARKNLENAKRYKIGNNLGMVAMTYTNISKDDAREIGFFDYDMYKDTGKLGNVIRVWLLNTSDKIIDVNPLNFKVTTKKGYTVPLSDYTFRTRNPFPSTSLEPGTKIDGFVVFGLNREDKIITIIYDDKIGNRVTREYVDALIIGFERDLKELGLIKK
jgi:hypothetical protein